MRRFVFEISLLFLGFLISVAQAQVNLDIHIGNAPAPPPPPVVVEPPPVVLQAPPHMIYDEGLRVYIGVGIPYDIFFYNNIYFYHVNGIWYRSPYYRGPWTRTEIRRIPLNLRKHRIEEIRGFRDRAWKEYRGHEGRYRGRHFQAEEPRGRHEREIR
ncbi:MAG: hypothetical protein ACYDBV_09935 [Nitrospiria bacterium]